MHTNPSKTGKVVYVLGAGFSKPAGAPNQAEILKRMFALRRREPRIRQAQTALRAFLDKDLCVGSGQIDSAALEDIYTPMDRCIADKTSLKSKSASDLAELRDQLEYLISHAISATILSYNHEHPGSSSYIHEFATYVVHKAARRALLAERSESSAKSKQYDPVSIVSLNWDILLDNAIYSALDAQDPRTGDYDPFGVVDYCCYVSSLSEGNSRIRSGLWSLGCRGYNVKLLKLHGSMNWLQCPNCQRLFVEFGEKQPILDQVGRTLCRHCDRCGHKNRLKGSLVMPTFLKDLSNFQVKLVWQNAGVELMEARRLVFIGYSLPHADFEFRQLLSRMVHRKAVIDVVLYKDSSAESRRSYRDEVQRYKQFFGARKITFKSSGVEMYIRSMVADPVPMP